MELVTSLHGHYGQYPLPAPVIQRQTGTTLTVICPTQSLLIVVDGNRPHIRQACCHDRCDVTSVQISFVDTSRRIRRIKQHPKRDI